MLLKCKEDDNINKLKLIKGNCLDKMKNIKDKSIDMILCDLPYGTTKCKWDTIIPFEELWEQYNRIIKENGVIALFGQEPFSSYLRTSNFKNYKYDWYWRKSKPLGFPNAKKMPLKDIEIISIFYKKQPTYNPQGLQPYNKTINRPKSMTEKGNHISAYNGGALKQETYVREFTNYPRQVLEFGVEGKCIHPTQKPVDLLEYLIITYSNENETILDNTMGSGSTGIACIETKRNFIGIELDNTYFETCKNRIETHIIDNNLQDIHIEIA